MKKVLIAIVLVLGTISLNSCKGEKKADEVTPEATTTEAGSEDSSTPESTKASEPKTYVVTVNPGTVSLGKNKEATVKIINLKAVDLSDPDGKSLGIQLSYDVELTNNNPIGQNSVQINPSEFRLELDNGQKITHDSYNSVSTAAESTATSTENIFKLPAGTKPSALNLFFDETRVTVKLELK